METINKDKILELVEKEKLTLKALNCDNQEVEISQHIEYFFDAELTEDNFKTIDKGYLIYLGEEEKEVETIKEVFDILEEEKFFKDDKIDIISFSNFKTYGEYLEDKAFINISMKDLLEKYKDADKFSLTVPYCSYSTVSDKKPFGENKLDGKLAQKALEKLEIYTLNNLKRTYDTIKETEQNILPFDALINNIKSEILDYREKKKRTLKKNGGECFICDQFSRGKTNFKEPQELWEFYHNLEMIKSFEWITEELKKNDIDIPLDNELNDAKYKALKNNLIEIEVTFVWHCTVSSQLSKVYYFKKNEETINWLLQFKDDYDIDFEDLAFYKDEEVVFSSCKHEGFHNDLTKKGE